MTCKRWNGGLDLQNWQRKKEKKRNGKGRSEYIGTIHENGTEVGRSQVHLLQLSG